MNDSVNNRSADARKFRWDVLLLVVFVATCVPSVTGLPLHEWVSIGFIAILAIHVALNWTWILRVLGPGAGPLQGEIHFNRVLDIILFASMALLMLSGLLVSEAAMPAIGLERRADPFWTRIHNTLANTFPSLVGIHLAMHTRWMLAKLRRKPSPAQAPAAPT